MKLEPWKRWWANFELAGWVGASSAMHVPCKRPRNQSETSTIGLFYKVCWITTVNLSSATRDTYGIASRDLVTANVPDPGTPASVHVTVTLSIQWYAEKVTGKAGDQPGSRRKRVEQNSLQSTFSKQVQFSYSLSSNATTSAKDGSILSGRCRLSIASASAWGKK
jgi:hypothetical protein